MAGRKKTTKAVMTTARTGGAVIYARVSSREQEEEDYSIPAQLRAIHEYAKKKGIVICGEFLEAETAKKHGRKEFDRMLKVIAERGVSAVLVEKTDRLYRNFSDFVKVDELGVDLHFVKEGQVIRQESHSSEKLMHSIKVCLAKNYVDNLSEEVKKGMREKARQGIYPTSAPLGYMNVGQSGRRTIEVDPERGPIIARIFEEYARGRVSLQQVTRMSWEWGLRTKKGHKPQKSTIADLLANPLYYGQIRWAGEVSVGTHEPLVAKAIFDRVQEIMSGRTSRAGYGHVEIAYRGLIRCSRCGGLLAGEIKKGKYIYYHCIGRRDGCDSPYVREEVLTDQYATVFARMAIPEDLLLNLKTALGERAKGEKAFHAEQKARLEAETDRLRKKLANLYEDKLSGEVSVEMYRNLRDRYELEMADIGALLVGVDSTRSNWLDEGTRLLELASSAADRFKQGSFAQRQQIVQIVCSNSVFDGQNLLIEPRPEFKLVLKALEEGGGEGPDSGENKNWSGRHDSNVRPLPPHR